MSSINLLKTKLQFYFILRHTPKGRMTDISPATLPPKALSCQHFLTHETPEDFIYQHIELANEHLDSINIPTSHEFYRFKQQEHIHVRSYWPTQAPKAVIFFLHGYASHFNRPVHQYLGEYFTNNDFIYVGLDFYGHGYSTGTRAYIPSAEDFVQSAYEVIYTFFAEEHSIEGKYHFERKCQLPKHTPLFVIGHSMGGAIAVLVTEKIQQEKEEQSKLNLQGGIFICPALALSSPPPVLRFVLEYIIAPFFAEDSMPDWAIKSNSNVGKEKTTWHNEHYERYVQHDASPENPKALSFKGNMRYGSAIGLLQLSDQATSLIPNITYPLLIFHDPQDQVVAIKGSKSLLNDSQTSLEMKELVEITDGLHDLLANKLGMVSRKIVSWIEEILIKTKATEAPHK